MSTNRPAAPRWRSILFIPVTSDRFLAKAHTRGADAIQLDLEDSIAINQKALARERLPAAIEQLRAHGVEIIVRVNRPWLMALPDLQAAVRPGVRAITLPKVEDPSQVRAADEIITELEQQAGLPAGQIGLLLLIESPAALPRLTELIQASPRVVALTLGPEDYCLAAGCSNDAESLLHPNLLIAQACAATGVRPLGFVGSIASFDDLEAFRVQIRQARRLGFRGAAIIHPGQVAILNEEFSPTAAEREWAQRVLEATARAAAEGVATFALDGKMVDRPVVLRAQSIVDDSR